MLHFVYQRSPVGFSTSCQTFYFIKILLMEKINKKTSKSYSSHVHPYNI